MRYALIVLIALCGCSLQDAYVAADSATFDAVAPAHERYVTSDESLDDEQRARRLRVLRAWKARIAEASK